MTMTEVEEEVESNRRAKVLEETSAGLVELTEQINEFNKQQEEIRHQLIIVRGNIRSIVFKNILRPALEGKWRLDKHPQHIEKMDGDGLAGITVDALIRWPLCAGPYEFMADALILVGGIDLTGRKTAHIVCIPNVKEHLIGLKEYGIIVVEMEGQ